MRTGVRIGTVAFAVGLSLAGPQALGVANADRDTSNDASHVSAPPKARTVKVPTRKVPTAKTVTRATVKVRLKPAAAQPPQRAASSAKAVSPVITGIANVLDSVRNWLSTLPANPLSDFLEGALLSLRRSLVPDPVIEAPISVGDATAPTITIHNTSSQTMWIYNLTNTGNYAIPNTPWTTDPNAPADWVGPVSIASGASAPVTLAVNNAAPGSPGNRIYIVEGSSGFTLPITSQGGVDPFNPTGSPDGDAFQNYSFIEYNLYPADGGYQYTIDTSYIDEWSLPVQMKFTVNGAAWTGAVDGKTYGFNDFDTVVSQLTAAGGPYSDLVWSGTNPWVPQPPAGVGRIIGPDKVWSQQSNEPASNFNMNNTGWVPTSYQNFVQYGFYQGANQQVVYPYAFNGNQLSTTQDNFDFWRFSVDGPASTPYAIALRTAAILDGFPADSNGVYGFFTYPNDETAGQFTNIPTAVSLDVYVSGAGDGVSATAIPGGVWAYSSSVAPTGTGPRVKTYQGTLNGTAGTDTFILNQAFNNFGTAPVILGNGGDGDIVVIDKNALGATSNTVDVVNRSWFLFNPNQSQFVYDRSTGNLYYDQNPLLPGYTGLLANLSQSSLNPADSIFVL